MYIVFYACQYIVLLLFFCKKQMFMFYASFFICLTATFAIDMITLLKLEFIAFLSSMLLD